MTLRFCLWLGTAGIVLCILLGSAPREADAQTPEFRAFWADAFHDGFKSTTQIDTMVSRAISGRYNAIFAEVLAFQDNVGGGHGAYWDSQIVPRATDVSGGIDPLAYLVQRAHANGIQVHPWLVAFRVSSSWPPSGNSTVAAHPEWLMVRQSDMGSVRPVIDGDSGTTDYYTFDPGNPEVQDYLMSIVRELVTDYAIDGIHWDYIRYTQSDAGYPTDTSCTKSSLMRFREITGYSGTPSPSYGAWNDFRRRTITEVVRRSRCEIPSITSNPCQPLRYSASLITWGNAPSTFTGSSAYARFQNWEEWMRLGFLDTGVPMTYYDYSVYPTYFRNWVNKEMAWRYQRQMVVGPATYLNTFDNSIAEMEYARNQGADGLSTYSYCGTRKEGSGWVSDWNWYTNPGTGVGRIFTSIAPIPEMIWRNTATATEGTLWGRVTDVNTTLPIDDASVQVGTMAPVRTDGGGYYVVTLITAGGSGTPYTVTASKPGYPTLQHSSILVVAGDVRRDDFSLGVTEPPTITQQPTSQDACPNTTTIFSVTANGGGASMAYQWRKDGIDLSNGGRYSGVNTSTLMIAQTDGADVGTYVCIVSNDAGSATSEPAALTLMTATLITLQPEAQSVCPGVTVIFSAAATGDGTVTYQWQKNGTDLTGNTRVSGVTTPTLTIANVDGDDSGDYRCIATAGCGPAVSAAAALTVAAPTTIAYSPFPRAVYPGDPATFTVIAGGAGTVAYQWQKDGSNVADDDHRSGTTTATLQILAADPNDVGTYRCIVSAECGSQTSEEASLTLKQFVGDIDSDFDVDLVDFSLLQGCFNGPNRPVQIGCGVDADIDGDQDVDLMDFSFLQLCFGGPNRPPASGCPRP